MTEDVVHCADLVTILGAGAASGADLEQALNVAPALIAADGGADFALDHGHCPDWVIGDFDSISQRARSRLDAARLIHVARQDNTDFDKCLARVRAQLILGVGFLGARLDHTLAALNSLARHPAQPCLLIGAQDVAFLCPPQLRLRLPVGSRLSLYPMGAVRGQSRGLEWPLDGIAFAPDGRIGTSNRVTDSTVELRFDARKMIVLLPRAAQAAAISALLAAGDVPEK